jgi:hypothetical protein
MESVQQQPELTYTVPRKADTAQTLLLLLATSEAHNNNMARSEKNTRVRGLPPKLFVQQKDGRTGSLPSKARVASDNRSGAYGVRFDDTNTINFVSGVIALGSGVPVGMIQKPAFEEFGQDIIKSEPMTVTSSVEKSVAPTFMAFTPGQAMTPFQDHDNPAADGKSNKESFYATGSLPSDVGEGFEQPLWAKSKIEIDLTPSVTHSFGIQNFLSTSNNFPMAYWNNTTKRYDGVGQGIEFDKDGYNKPNLQGLKNFLEEQTFGFQGSLLIDTTGLSIFDASLLFQPISNFGFPNHPKYEADSDHYIEVSDYIDSPFLLEKIVLVFSGAMDLNGFPGGLGTDIPIHATSFFILNQKSSLVQKKYISSLGERLVGPQRITYISESAGIGTPFSASFTTGSNLDTHARDLVTWAQVVMLSGAHGLTDETFPTAERELTITTTSSWSGKFALSGAVKSPLAYDEGFVGAANTDNVLTQSTPEYKNQWANFGRNQIGDTGRNFLNVLGATSASVTGSVPSYYFRNPSSGPAGDGRITQSLNRSYSKPNPYMIYPGDRLIFGWEVPYSYRGQQIFPDRIGAAGLPVYGGLGPQLSFATSPQKIILYGSQVKEGKEHHDTLNQLLTTVVVHEVIE